MVMLRSVMLSLGALAALSLGVSAARCEEPGSFQPFVKESYEQGDFDVTTQTYAHGRVKIRITQARRTGLHVKAPPFYCRAWLEVVDKGEHVWQKSFDDIVPANFSYGLFVPRKAPSPRYFAAIKAGDNDGRLFLVDRENAAVFDLPGGFYFVSSDNRYLFSEYAGDKQQLVVFDLIAGKVVLDSENPGAARLPGEIYDWYYDGKKYYFTIVREDEKLKGVIAEDRRALYEVNVNRAGLFRVPADFSRVFHKRWDFDPRPFRDCSSGPARTKDEESGDGGAIRKEGASR